jgi:hypothetical protein
MNEVIPNMPSERVLNLPLSSDEIIEILLQRFEKRLRSDCFLHQANTYNGFSYTMELKLKFNDMMMGRDTLVWDEHVEPKRTVHDDVQAMLDTPMDHPSDAEKETASTETFDSGDSPNRARVEHDLPLPVETMEGRKKVIRHRRME